MSEPFRGFYPPEYTMVPNDLFDALLPDLSGAELKVLLYLMRQTFGWHRGSVALSLSQLEHATGLTRKTLVVASRSLEERGCIVAERGKGTDGVAMMTVYRLRIVEREGGGVIPPRQGNNPSTGRGIVPQPFLIEERNPVKETEATEVWTEILARATLTRDIRSLFAELPARLDGDTLVVRCPANLRGQAAYVERAAGRVVRWVT